MWTIVFLVLLFTSDKRIILATFLIAGIVQGVESYFDYKVKLGYQEVLNKSSVNINGLLKQIVTQSIEDMSIYRTESENIDG